jgi:hypothetical protein
MDHITFYKYSGDEKMECLCSNCYYKTFVWQTLEIYENHGLYVHRGMEITSHIIMQYLDLHRILARYKLNLDPKPLKWLCAWAAVCDNVNTSSLPRSLRDWCYMTFCYDPILDEEWMVPSLLLGHLKWNIN